MFIFAGFQSCLYYLPLDKLGQITYYSWASMTLPKNAYNHHHLKMFQKDYVIKIYINHLAKYLFHNKCSKKRVVIKLVGVLPSLYKLQKNSLTISRLIFLIHYGSPLFIHTQTHTHIYAHTHMYIIQYRHIQYYICIYYIPTYVILYMYIIYV